MFFFYRCIVIFLFPIIVLLVLLRVLLNKEDKKRFKEKLFSSSFNFKKNSEKDLIWFHVASIGELKSISALLKNLSKKDNYEILVTTVTLSSSELFKKEFINEKNIKHRFFPIDKPSLVKNFLNNWSPSKIIFVDSEIWPNFLFEINKRNIPLILLNGRITEKTFMRWNLFPTLAKQVFKTFDLCLASSNESKKFLDKLSAKNVKYFGNLKLTVEDELNSRKDNNQKLLSKKQVWCGASIHKGEEVFCIKTHLNLKKNLHQIMTILIPRHTDSVKNIKLTAEKFNLNFQILSAGDQIDMSKEIIIINSYGEISNYLTLCRSVFMGKSMIKKLENVGFPKIRFVYFHIF